MKKYLVLSMVLAMAVGVSAQPLLMEGTREWMVEANYDPEGPGGTEYSLGVGYGVFMRDALEVGGIFTYSSADDGDNKTMGIEGLAEYHFDRGTMMVPYVGARIGWNKWETVAADNDAMVYGPRVGVKQFLADNVAIDIALEYMMASDDIFVNDGEVEDTNMEIVVGMRMLLW